MQSTGMRTVPGGRAFQLHPRMRLTRKATVPRISQAAAFSFNVKACPNLAFLTHLMTCLNKQYNDVCMHSVHPQLVDLPLQRDCNILVACCERSA